jgi:hypothetical protein
MRVCSRDGFGGAGAGAGYSAFDGVHPMASGLPLTEFGAFSAFKGV